MILAELYVLRMNKLSSAKEGVVLLEQMSVYSEKDLSELVSIINSKNVYAENITDTCNRNGKYCFVFDKMCIRDRYCSEHQLHIKDL